MQHAVVTKHTRGGGVSGVDLIRTRLDGALSAIKSLREQVESIDRIGRLLVERIEAGGTIFTSGNGGSAAEAMHLAEELIGRYRDNRPPIRAVCLNADPTALTCIANDFGYDAVFARQCEALARPGDVLIVFSTSGSSENLIRGLDQARRNGATTVGLLGRDGGPCRGLCDHALVVEADDSAHIQEAHQVVMHVLCEYAEDAQTPHPPSTTDNRAASEPRE